MKHQRLDANGAATLRIDNEPSGDNDPPGLDSAVLRPLNDPLTIAFNYLFAAKNILKSNQYDTASQAVDYLQLASNALEEVSDGVRSRARKSTIIEEPEQAQKYALQDAIYEAATLALLPRENCEIRAQIKCPPQLPYVSIKRTHVHQLIINFMLYLIETSPSNTIEKFAIELTTLQYGHISVALFAVPFQTTPKTAPSAHRVCLIEPAKRLKHCQTILQKCDGKFISVTTNSTNKSFLFTLPNLI